MSDCAGSNAFLIERLLDKELACGKGREHSDCGEPLDLISKEEKKEPERSPSGEKEANGKCTPSSVELPSPGEEEREERRPALDAHLQRIFANFSTNCQQAPARSTALQQFPAVTSYGLQSLSQYLSKCQLMQHAAIQWSATLSTAQSLQRAVAASSLSSIRHIRGTDGRGHRHRTDGPALSRSTTKKYRCDICEKTFSRSNTLITHKRIHTGEKPFQCDHCGRAFRQPGNLTRHRLTHTTVKPYVCSLCEKAFNRASNLHTHMRTHSQASQRTVHASPLPQDAFA